MPSSKHVKRSIAKSFNTKKSANEHDTYFNWSSAGFSYWARADDRDAEIQALMPASARVSMRSKLESWLENSNAGKIIDVVSVLLSLVSCAFYIQSTYEPLSPLLRDLELAFVVFFSVEYALRFTAAEHKVAYVFSPLAMVDLLTIVPVVLEYAGEEFTRLGFLRFMKFLRVVRIFRMFKLLRVLRMHRVMRLSDVGITRQVLRMVWTAMSIVFCAAGLFQIVENWDDGHDTPQYGDSREVGDSYTFVESTYFIVVTVTTVGFGEIHPRTSLGQMFVVATIIFTFVVLPQQSAELVELIRARPKHRGAYLVTKLPHVLVVGSFDENTVLAFLTEFFHEVHGVHQTRAVFMSPFVPSQGLEAVFTQRLYASRVMFLQGSVFEDHDLLRAGAHSAKAVFFLTDAFGEGVNNVAADQATVLRVAAVRNASPKPEIFAEIMNADMKTQLLSSGANHVLCAAELKVHVLAISSVLPGFSALLCNLVTSNDPPDEALWMELDERMRVAPGKVPPPLAASTGAIMRTMSSRTALISGRHLWHTEYSYGAAMEVYPIRVPARYGGVTFADAVMDIYERTGTVLFALKVPIRRASSSQVKYERAPGRAGASAREAGDRYVGRSGRIKTVTSEDDDELLESGAGWDSFGNLADGEGHERLGREALILNPAFGLVLEKGDLGFVIALNDDAAARVSALGITHALPPVHPIPRPPPRSAPPVPAPTAMAETTDDKSANGEADDGAPPASDSKESSDSASPREAKHDAHVVGAERDSAGSPTDRVGHLTLAPLRTGHSPAVPSGASSVASSVEARQLHDARELRGHTIVCPGGSEDMLRAFVQACRDQPRSTWRDLLILIPDMRGDIWEPISVFPRVYWQRGSQLSHADLNRANIVRSFSVVIFAAPESRQLFRGGGQVDEVQTNDFKTIMTGYAAQSFDTDTHIISDLVYPSNGKFLRVRRPTHFADPVSTSAAVTDEVGGDPRGERSMSAEGEFIQTRNLRSASVNQALQGAQIKSLRKRSDGGKPKGALASFASGLSRRTFRFARPIRATAPIAVEELPTAKDPMADPRNVLKERMLEDRSGDEDGQEEVAFEESDGINPDGAGKAFFKLKAFATGAFFSSRMLQLLPLQAYYNRYLVSIVGAFLRAGPGFVPDGADHKADDRTVGTKLATITSEASPAGVPGSVPESPGKEDRERKEGTGRDAETTAEPLVFAQAFLRQVPVPESCVGRSCATLFRALLTTRGAIMLGLMRAPRGPGGAMFSYVYTNPRAVSEVARGDRAFVLLAEAS